MIGRLNLNGDSIGYVEMYDFSTGNRSYKDRVEVVQMVASICYNSKIKSGSSKLFKMLGTESAGLPSSSYEFVPVLLRHEVAKGYHMQNSMKYGEFVEDGRYVLTNLRALIADVGEDSDKYYNESFDEISIIRKHFKVFKSKIDLATARQLMRHRCSWQERSRRYVSGEKLPFEFYIPNEIRGAISIVEELDSGTIELDTVDLANQCVKHYDELIRAGVKPEDARRVLPQSMYTVAWSAWQPSQLENMIELRTHRTAQSEVRKLADEIDNMVFIWSS